MDSSGESRDTCFFVNYKRGLTFPKTELDSMSKRKLTTKFEEEPFFVWKHKNDDANFSARIKKAVFSPDNCKKRYIFGRDHFIILKRLKTDS